MHWILRYAIAPDYLERRAGFRDAHLALAWESADTGALLLGGEAAARAFAHADPYVANGLVTGWEVLPWNTVVGGAAANPVRPAA